MKLKKGDTVKVIAGKDKGQEGEIVHVYLAAKLRHARRAAIASLASTRRAPVPIVVQMPVLHSRFGPRRPPASARGRSS